MRDKLEGARKPTSKPAISGSDLYYLWKLAVDMIEGSEPAQKLVTITGASVSKEALAPLRTLYVALKKYKDPMSKADILKVAKDIYEQGPAEKVMARVLIWQLRATIRAETSFEVNIKENGPLVLALSEYFPDD